MYVPQGINYVSEILSKSNNYIVYYDPDIDGLMAGSLVTNFLNAYEKPNIYYINENREHGFKLPLEKLKNYVGSTIIAVDFSIEEETLKAIVDMGINIINIDHHDIRNSELFTYSNNRFSCVVVNNQYEFEPKEQRYLSGAGMVYYVLASMFPDYTITQQNRAMVGISLLSDVREIENNEAAHFLDALFSWSGDYVNYLIELTQGSTSASFGIQKHLDRNFLDYLFCPKFNALFRLNRGDEAIALFNRVKLDIDLNAVRGEQKEIEAELLKHIAYVYSGTNLEVLQVDISSFGDAKYNITNFIGLACGSLKNKSGKTTMLYVCDGSRILRGSVRGACDNVDYLGIFNSNGINGAGHKGAFGVRDSDMTAVNFEALNNQIVAAEEVENREGTNSNRIVIVPNLRIAIMSDKRTPVYNTYVRDVKRRLYDCSQCLYKVTYESATKDYIQYNIDGVTVKCFDKTLTPDNGGYVMPLLNNGYTEFYLKKL